MYVWRRTRRYHSTFSEIYQAPRLLSLCLSAIYKQWQYLTTIRPRGANDNHRFAPTVPTIDKQNSLDDLSDLRTEQIPSPPRTSVFSLQISFSYRVKSARSSLQISSCRPNATATGIRGDSNPPSPHVLMLYLIQRREKHETLRDKTPLYSTTYLPKPPPAILPSDAPHLSHQTRLSRISSADLLSRAPPSG